MICDFLRNSYVISYDNIRLLRFYQLFRIHGIYPFPKHFPAFQHKKLTGPENCSLSHAAIIANAKAQHLPFVCIFEDDAYPCKNASTRLAELTDIPASCQLLLLGWCNIGKKKIQHLTTKYNAIETYIGGSQSYIIFKDAYDEYLQRYQQTKADMIFNELQEGYMLKSPIFIQYSQHMSMNNHFGYIFDGDHHIPPNGFLPIENYFQKDN